MKKKILLLIVCAICQASSVSAGGTVIISGHPEYPPITWKEGNTITGVAAELAKTVFTEIGVPYEIKTTGPWKRVQMNAREGAIDVITSAYTNPERQTYMDYTIPFMKDPVSVFVMKGNIFPFNRWEDLIGKRGNTVLGESYGKEFDQFIEQKLQVERTSRVIQNFLKLEKGRVDYAIIGLYPGLACATVTGYKDKIEVLSNPIVEENFYMTFSKKSEFRHLLPKANKIIKRLKNEGAVEKWIEKYLDYYKTTQRKKTE
ncbi:MAG: transporter substrate-binding domain-containing protein [Desulfobacteraceae bacterium]|nr:transporter substrate-binding domain-containing protein [Desulfobacteraceae bacterium]